VGFDYREDKHDAKNVDGRGRELPSHNYQVCQLGAAHAPMGAQSNDLRYKQIGSFSVGPRLYSRNHILSASAPARSLPRRQSRGRKIGSPLMALPLTDPVHPVNLVGRRLGRSL